MTLAAACGALIVAVGLGSARGASLGGESWYDADHGWRIHSSNIQESNDGGRTWRNLFSHPFSDTNLNGVLRTGLRAGLYYEGGTRGYTVNWTNDGRRFFYSPQLRQPVTGEGRFLFFWVGGKLYRVSPWPFPRKCVGTTPTGMCLYEAKKGKRLTARFAVSLVGQVADGFIGAATTVPGGVVAVSHAATKPAVLEARWVRGGSPNVTSSSLPAPETVRLDSCSAQGVFVDWPLVVIEACSVDGANLVPAGYWESSNGGSSWEYRP